MAEARNLGLFPFCIQSFDPLTVDTAILLYWRINSWIVEDSSGSLGGYLPPVGTILNFATYTPIGSEKDLICTRPAFAATWVAESETLGDEENTIYEILEIFIESSSGEFRFGVGLSVSEIGTSADGAEVGTLNVNTMLGNFTLPLRWRYSDGDIPSLDLTIRANSYWPYDPEDGLGPIYNSSTGEKLRP